MILRNSTLALSGLLHRCTCVHDHAIAGMPWFSQWHFQENRAGNPFLSKEEAKQLQITNSTHSTKTAQPNCSLTESKENGHPARKHGSSKQASDIAHTLISRKEIRSGSSDGGFGRLPAPLGLLCLLHNLHLQPNDDATRITSNP